MKKFCKRAYLALILIFLYLPIVVLIVQSFNAGKSRAKWEGFSFRWYTELFHDTRIMNALTVTVTIALLAMVVATILGPLAAIGIHAFLQNVADLTEVGAQGGQHSGILQGHGAAERYCAARGKERECHLFSVLDGGAVVAFHAASGKVFDDGTGKRFIMHLSWVHNDASLNGNRNYV